MTIQDAVTAVLVWHGKVLMIKRQPHLLGFPGYAAFPGGKVDPADYHHPEPESGAQPAVPPSPLRRALIRELHEELGIDLEWALGAGVLAGITELTAATTPDFHPNRFHNRFYRIDLRESLAILPDAGEVADWAWYQPAEFLAEFRKGQILAVPPVLRLMEELAKDIELTRIDGIDFVYDQACEVPCFEALAGIHQLLVRSATAPPADRTNAFIIGGVLIDPSPSSTVELDKLRHVLDRFPLESLFLTHHHRDHHQFADVIARERGLPIGLSRITHARMLKTMGATYFDGIELRFFGEGDVLTHWLDMPVCVYAVPGHDDGQLGLAPANMAWFLVGDLIQGVGTVVVAAPEGNMSVYFQTLQRVIDLDPAVILPSHGMAMGGTYRIRATLAHREQRENQVLQLHQAGKSPQAMLPIIYENLNPQLMPFALANIQAHLAKLRFELRI